MTAYHESTHQPRATINLAKAVKLIDEETNLKQQPSAKSGGRRKSAFGSEEDGYMFLEEGFRVRFANGETIDFYADNVAAKRDWMQALVELVGRDSKPSKSWTELVLKNEKRVSARRDRHHERSKIGGEAKTKASSAVNGVVPGPRTSSSRRPNSAHLDQPAQLKQGDVMGPPAPPAKDRAAKARSTYY